MLVIVLGGAHCGAARWLGCRVRLAWMFFLLYNPAEKLHVRQHELATQQQPKLAACKVLARLFELLGERSLAGRPQDAIAAT